MAPCPGIFVAIPPPAPLELATLEEARAVAYRPPEDNGHYQLAETDHVYVGRQLELGKHKQQDLSWIVATGRAQIEKHFCPVPIGSRSTLPVPRSQTSEE